MSEGIHAIGAIIAAIIGLAIVAVIVSNNANTGTVITDAGSSLSSVITAAVSPVSGGAATANALLAPSQGTIL